MTDDIIQWLLDGDISIQYQVYRDLLDEDKPSLQAKITAEGWGKLYLDKRNNNGHWGDKFYFPKWRSSHYTLLDLRYLCPPKNTPAIVETIDMVATHEKSDDGGIALTGETRYSDVCVNGMFLNYACYFQIAEPKLESLVDFLLKEHMADGGFNCRSTRSGCVHSSLHTTISVLEGITEYEKNGYQYRLEELHKAKLASIEFMLEHRLFKSDKTGKIIRPDFLKLVYPGRWKYNILRALDYLQYEKADWDPRMQDAIDILLKKRNKQNTWNVQAKHPGELHFEMEKAGKPSRWNTLRALRVLKHFNIGEQPN